MVLGEVLQLLELVGPLVQAWPHLRGHSGGVHVRGVRGSRGRGVLTAVEVVRHLVASLEATHQGGVVGGGILRRLTQRLDLSEGAVVAVLPRLSTW